MSLWVFWSFFFSCLAMTLGCMLCLCCTACKGRTVQRNANRWVLLVFRWIRVCLGKSPICRGGTGDVPQELFGKNEPNFVILCTVPVSPPAKSQNPSPPLHPTTDKLGFSGCLEQSVVTPNPVVGQSTGVHNQSNDDLFRQMEKCMRFHGN